jgi:uncharacterized protein DUF6578
MLVAVLWPVFYEGWQMECCGDPFTVGDRVEWTLVVRFEVEPWSPRTTGVEVDLHVEWYGDTPIVRLADLVACVDPDAVKPGPQTIAFAEDHHGDVPGDFPTTAGVVRRIQVASVEYQLEKDCYMPLAETAELRDVEISPKWFRSDRSGDEREPPVGFRGETGMLVTLEVGA